MFPKKSIKNIDLKDKTVLLRTDYNVPLEDGEVVDDYRIKQSLPTINSLLDQNCRIIIISHAGRPDGKVEKSLSLKPIAQSLSQLLKTDVEFVGALTMDGIHRALKPLKHGQIAMLENLRFHHEEEANSDKYAKALASLAEVFVQDGFGVVHRAHASTAGIPKHIPAVAGLLLEKEVGTLSRAIKHPRRPLLTIVGGVKLETKVDLLDRFIDIADIIAVGGAMANTILAAMDHKIGKSIFDKNELKHAKRIVKECQDKGTRLILPDKDVGVAHEVDEDEKRRNIQLKDIRHDDMILDYGPESLKAVLHAIKEAGTVIWNGPLGMLELPEFRWSSEQVAKQMASEHDDSIVGGGDTAGFIDELGLVPKFMHVSTGGGAALELLSGKSLPGVEALLDKQPQKGYHLNHKR